VKSENKSEEAAAAVADDDEDELAEVDDLISFVTDDTV
jgi:hypothetical protein